jgi:NitT/TauT family transport system substrate-binding protein
VSRLNGRFRTVVGVALVAAMAVAVTGCSGSGDKKKSGTTALDKVTYLTAFGAVGRDAFAWVAQSKGYFKEQGLDVTVQPGASGTENLKQLAAGTVQYAALDMTGAWINAGKGDFKDFRAIMAVHEQGMVSIMSLDGSGITAPKDLEGKTVAAATGSVNKLLFPAYAKLAGFDDKRVTWKDAPTTSLTGLLINGQVNALSQFAVGKAAVEKMANGKKVNLLPYSQYLSDLYGNGIVTSAKIDKENPDQAKRFRTAMVKALKYTNDHPEEAAQILNKAQPTAAIDTATAEINIAKPYVGTGNAVGTFDQARVAKAIATLQGNGLIPAGLTPTDVVDFNVAPKP